MTLIDEYSEMWNWEICNHIKHYSYDYYVFNFMDHFMVWYDVYDNTEYCQDID